MDESAPTPAHDGTTPAFLRTRFSVMMFLQYAIWGAWLPILYPFLLGHRGFGLDQVGAILAGGAAGAIIGPFIAGQIADRYFATERFLAVSHLIGAVLVWFLAGVGSFWPFLGISVIYGIVYAPTLALTNSICFHHLPDRDSDFGKVRVWGTIGWIAAGIVVGQWLLLKYTPVDVDAAIQAAEQNAGRADAFKLSAVLGIIMGFYCFSLPHTPPARAAREANATLEAIKEAKRQPLITLFLLAVPVSMIHQFYFVHAAQFLSTLQTGAATDRFVGAVNRVLGVGGGGLMTIGQMTEIAVLALIPLFAKRVGRKWLLAVGLVAYALRMVVFAYLTPIHGATGIPEVVLAILGISMHGFCFGCFIFVSFMIVDEQTTPDVRASAQNLFNLVIVGIGIIVGSWFATSIVGSFAMDPVLDAAGQPVLDEAGDPLQVMNYGRLFAVPMWMSVGCLVALVALYPSKVRKVEPSSGDPGS